MLHGCSSMSLTTPTCRNKFAGSVDDKTILGTWPEGKGGITVTEGDMNRCVGLTLG